MDVVIGLKRRAHADYAAQTIPYPVPPRSQRREGSNGSAVSPRLGSTSQYENYTRRSTGGGATEPYESLGGGAVARSGAVSTAAANAGSPNGRAVIVFIAWRSIPRPETMR